MIDKPVSPSCERNRDAILAVLRAQFAERRHVLEVGSGTGQHAVHFAAAMPWLDWQCSDLPPQLPGIEAWIADAGLPNTPPPISLDVARGPWPAQGYDAVFSANTFHIMGWPEVEAFFEGLPSLLVDDASLVIYGPFNYGGEYTSDSNRDFDAWLEARNPVSGIRDFERVDALARGIGLRLVEDSAMPANNRCLSWRRP